MKPDSELEELVTVVKQLVEKVAYLEAIVGVPELEEERAKIAMLEQGLVQPEDLGGCYE